ncbi:copper-translocating P-type ATPase, partial [Burkholderia sp. TJI49]
MNEPLASAALHTIELGVDGMHCGGCTGRVQRALAAVPGVVDAAVDLDRQSATVTALETVEPARLVEAVGEAGYPAVVREAGIGAAAAARTHEHRAAMPAASGAADRTLPADTTIELDIDG